ncbi:MAG: hypothetical protein HZB40_13145 [Rhodocyclales bacterium]|nr:hypothetical protein [Rhodocyclales bacterium]
MVDYRGDQNSNSDNLGVVVNLSANAVTTDWQGVTFGPVASGTALDGWGSTDTLSGFEKIYGSDYNDFLVGDTGANYIYGGKGSDLIGAGGGGDTVDGGAVGANASFDWLSYGQAGGAISVNLGTHAASGISSLQNIDGVLGGSFDDTLIGGDSTNQWFNGEKFEWFEGRGGNDSIDGGRGTTAAMTEATREYNFARYTSATGSVTVNLSTGTASDGLSGTDTLVGINGVVGSNQADTLVGGNEAFDLIELFEGRGGNDSIDGGRGFDMVMYRDAAGAVTVNLSTNSASSASTGTDTLSNIEGVIGSDYNDTMIGGSAAENFQGRKGADNIDGGGGVDQVDYHGDENGQ